MGVTIGNNFFDGLYLALDARKNSSYPGTGTTWYDMSGNGNDFTVSNGSPTWNSEGYFSFDGTDDAFSRSGSIPSYSELTVCIGFYTLNTADTFEGLLLAMDNANSNDYNSDNWVINVGNYNPTRFGIEESGGIWTTGGTELNYYSGAISMNSEGVKIYLDGVLNNSNSSSKGPWTDHNIMRIGNRKVSGTIQHYYTGRIYYVYVWHRKFDEEQLKAITLKLKNV